MENKDIKKVEVNDNSRKMVNLKGVNLSKEQLVIKDEKLRSIMSAQFIDLTDEQLRELQLCKAKVVKVDRVDRYGNRSSYYEGQFILCDGIIFKKRLDDNEMLSISNFNPELITEGKSNVYIPVKLMSFIKKDGSRAFNFTACLTPGVYLGTSKKNKADNGFIDEKTLNNIIAYNLTKKSKPNEQIKFVEMTSEEFDAIKKSINDDLELTSVDEF